MHKAVAVLDPRLNLVHRYVVRCEERPDGGWGATVTRVAPGAQLASMQLPKGNNRPKSARGAQELAWEYLKDRHPGLGVPSPLAWSDLPSEP